MTRLKSFNQTPAIDHIRVMVKKFGKCPARFTNLWSFVELWAIYRAWELSGSSRPPHKWSRRQVKEALIGRVPRWDKQGLALTPK